MIREKYWKWFGLVGHFICGRWCRFHMATQIGDHFISTVGLYVHPRHSQGSEQAEIKFLAENPNGEQIGYDRTYETMVFRAGLACTATDCDCGMPQIDGHELDYLPANSIKEAQDNHMMLCKKWANPALAMRSLGK